MADALPLSTSLPDRLAGIFEALFRWVATYDTRNKAAGPLIGLAWTRLRRLSARFAALVAAIEAGQLPAAGSGRGLIRRVSRPPGQARRQHPSRARGRWSRLGLPSNTVRW